MQSTKHSIQFKNSVSDALHYYECGRFDTAEAKLRSALEVLNDSRGMSLKAFVREFGRQELAKAMGINVSAIDKWTSGEHRPSVENCQILLTLSDGRIRLSEVLGVKR